MTNSNDNRRGHMIMNDVFPAAHGGKRPAGIHNISDEYRSADDWASWCRNLAEATLTGPSERLYQLCFNTAELRSQIRCELLSLLGPRWTACTQLLDPELNIWVIKTDNNCALVITDDAHDILDMAAAEARASVFPEECN
jgi:hypothetical protein